MIYLASPYTDPDPRVRNARYQWAMRAVAAYMPNPVFSPILYYHNLALSERLPTDFEYWKQLNDQWQAASTGFAVLPLVGWDVSKGVQYEIQLAEARGQTINYLDLDGYMTTSHFVAEASIREHIKWSSL